MKTDGTTRVVKAIVTAEPLDATSIVAASDPAAALLDALVAATGGAGRELPTDAWTDATLVAKCSEVDR